MRRDKAARAHGEVMPRLATRCDEASVVRRTQHDPAMPSWPEADRRMHMDARAKAAPSEPGSRGPR